MGITSELSRFCAEITLDHLPPQLAERARFLVLDLVGNIVRARHDAESTGCLPRRCPRDGPGGGQCRRVRRRRALHPGGRGVPQRRAGTLAGFRRHARRRLAASGRAGHSGRARRRRDGGRLGGRRAGGHRRRLRGYLPGRPRAAGGGTLRPRLPPHRDLRRVRRGGGGGAGVRAGRGRCGRRARHRAEPVRRQPAVPGQRRLDEALPGRLGGDERADGGDPGARGVQGRGRGAGRPPRLPARLCAQSATGPRGAGSRPRLRTDAHRGEALPVLPLRPCRDRRGVGVARRTRAEARRDRARDARPAARRPDADRRAGGRRRPTRATSSTGSSAGRS